MGMKGVLGMTSVTSAQVRARLTQALSDEELTQLCYDHFRSVYEQFSAGMSKSDHVQRLLDYCERRGQVEELLAHVREINPAAAGAAPSPPEAGRASTVIHNVEGSVIFGPVNTGGGDFVGRDQVKQSARK
jgi:hypothetical protein